MINCAPRTIRARLCPCSNHHTLPRHLRLLNLTVYHVSWASFALTSDARCYGSTCYTRYRTFTSRARRTEPPPPSLPRTLRMRQRPRVMRNPVPVLPGNNTTANCRLPGQRTRPATRAGAVCSAADAWLYGTRHDVPWAGSSRSSRTLRKLVRPPQSFARWLRPARENSQGRKAGWSG